MAPNKGSNEKKLKNLPVFKRAMKDLAAIHDNLCAAGLEETPVNNAVTTAWCLACAQWSACGGEPEGEGEGNGQEQDNP